MRRLALLIVLSLLATPFSTAHASPGLPRIGALEVGPYRAEIFSDSLPALASGTSFTVAVFALPQESSVVLKLVGPNGAVVQVPLGPLKVLEGPADAHGGDGHGAKASADHGAKAGDGHGAKASDGHGAASGAGHGAASGGSHGAAEAGHGEAGADHQADKGADHDDEDAGDHHDEEADHHDEEADDHSDDDHAIASFNARGKAVLKTAGTWIAVLEITDDHGETLTAQAPFEVERGGPSVIYLGFTGALMVGTMLYGLITPRHRNRAGGNP